MPDIYHVLYIDEKNKLQAHGVKFTKESVEGNLMSAIEKYGKEKVKLVKEVDFEAKTQVTYLRIKD